MSKNNETTITEQEFEKIEKFHRLIDKPVALFLLPNLLNSSNEVISKMLTATNVEKLVGYVRSEKITNSATIKKLEKSIKDVGMDIPHDAMTHFTRDGFDTTESMKCLKFGYPITQILTPEDLHQLHPIVQNLLSKTYARLPDIPYQDKIAFAHNWIYGLNHTIRQHPIIEIILGRAAQNESLDIFITNDSVLPSGKMHGMYSSDSSDIFVAIGSDQTRDINNSLATFIHECLHSVFQDMYHNNAFPYAAEDEASIGLPNIDKSDNHKVAKNYKELYAKFHLNKWTNDEIALREYSEIFDYFIEDIMSSFQSESWLDKMHKSYKLGYYDIEVFPWFITQMVTLMLKNRTEYAVDNAFTDSVWNELQSRLGIEERFKLPSNCYFENPESAPLTDRAKLAQEAIMIASEGVPQDWWFYSDAGLLAFQASTYLTKLDYFSELIDDRPEDLQRLLQDKSNEMILFSGMNFDAITGALKEKGFGSYVEAIIGQNDNDVVEISVCMGEDLVSAEQIA